MADEKCLFCEIKAGTQPSKKIYEDDKVTAILDIKPLNPGHILLFPKEHYSLMNEIPEDLKAHLFMIAKFLSHACLKGMGCQGTNIFLASGAAAGQKAQHSIIHIIPRFENDKITSFELAKNEIPEEEYGKINQIIKINLN